MKQKFNSLYLGLALGICIPLIALVIYSLFNNNNFVFNDIFQSFSKDDLYSSLKKELLTKVLSLCVIPNLLAFFGFLQINRLLSARGILIATFVYGIIIVMLKFVI